MTIAQSSNHSTRHHRVRNRRYTRNARIAPGQQPIDLGRELVVDLFAGGGGASLGLKRAYREPDVAVNHDPVAIAVHRANHPNCTHYTCDVFEIDPRKATQCKPVGVLWASPDCRHHSKAAGRKPRSKRVRGLAWVVIKWADATKPRLIHLENVEEFADWGPLLKDGSPCKVRKGITFRRWVRDLEKLGYRVEHRELIAADFGAPTIRKRLYVIARCDGRPIIWPRATSAHAKHNTTGLKPWRSAAECIDFSLPSHSIFLTKAQAKAGKLRIKRPLERATFTRIAKGVWRYVCTAAEPFIVSNIHNNMPQSHDAPLSTLLTGNHKYLATPVIAPALTERGSPSYQRTLAAAHMAHMTHQDSRAGHSVLAPLRTVTAAHRGEQALITTFMEQANTGMVGHDCREPVSTIVGKGCTQRLVTAYLMKYFREGGQWQGCDEPLHTVTTKHRMGLVEVIHVPADILAQDLRTRAKQVADFLHDHLPEHFPERADLVLLGDYVLVDITLRMLTPRELARAQGFPEDYILERGWFVDAKTPAGEWRPVTKTDQVRLIGNSVCPDVAEAIVAANAADLVTLYEGAVA